MTLVTYRQIWTRRTRDGWDYAYVCTWSDGSETIEHTLPWGRMDGAVEVSCSPPDQTR